MTLPIPRVAADLTPEWFSAALGRPVTRAEIEPVGVGVGLVGTLFRADLGDLRCIAKLAAPTDEGRFVATVLNMYGREVGFYTELSPRTPVAHPNCYYAAHDAATQDTVLLLEDVSTRGAMQDQVRGCSISAAEPALRDLARLHAAFWDDPELEQHEWLLRLGDEPYPSAVAFAYETAWPTASALFDDVIDERVTKLAASYAASIPALFAKLSEPPLVLSHADWRLDNLFFTPDGHVVAVDWQLIDRTVGPRDLAYFVSQSLAVEQPDDYKTAFRIYVDELRAHGVAVDEDWAWNMYRYGALLGFVYPIVAAGALTIEDPRHVELTRSMLVRSVAALHALDAFDLAL